MVSSREIEKIQLNAGVAAIPCVCLGMLLGGYLVKKCNLSPVGIVKLGMTANVLCSAAFVFLLFLGCETGPVAGVTADYINGTEWNFPRNLSAWCNEGCGCSFETLIPICGADGITYLSPCFAGCIDKPFNVSVVCTFRAVNPLFKSYALGIQFLLLRLLVFIPMPLVFGAAIDSACLVWSESCGKRTTCSVYNNDTYRYLYFSVSVGLKTAAFILMTMTWHCIKSNPKKHLQGDEDSTEKLTPTELFASTLTLDTAGTTKSATARTTFIYHLGDNEMCENIESVL
ncbi:UNVERIFIED_CONTAM: hypothetical protein FKN15_066178 [Acipenser sinensis]